MEVFPTLPPQATTPVHIEMAAFAFDGRNMKTNRVPTASELVSLQDSVRQNQDHLQHLIDQLQSARSTYEALCQRYTEQTQALQLTFAQMNAASSLLSMLEGQRQLVEANLNHLEGLVHPIRRCPTEILQEIFEWAACKSYHRLSSFQVATRISHVCRHWRDVALQTPALWDDIVVFPGADPEELEAFMTRTTERLKAKAPSIYISNITGLDDAVKAINLCRLDSFTDVRCLEIWLDNYQDAFTTILENKIRLPSGRIRELTVGFKGQDEEHQPTADLQGLLKMFPTVHTLYLSMFLHLEFGPQTVLHNVKRIKFHGCFSASLASIASTFPNAERVHFFGTTFTPDSGGEIHWNHLKSFNLPGCGGVPWAHLRMPSLEHIMFGSRYEANQQALSFVGEAVTIRHLETGLLLEEIPSILSITPRVTTLTTRCFNLLVKLPRSKLPNLEILVLTPRNNELSLEMFEKIVRKYCLVHTTQKGGKKSGGESQLQQVKELRVIMDYGSTPSKSAWGVSTLLSSATETFMMAKHWDELHQYYCYRWG